MLLSCRQAYFSLIIEIAFQEEISKFYSCGKSERFLRVLFHTHDFKLIPCNNHIDEIFKECEDHHRDL